MLSRIEAKLSKFIHSIMYAVVWLTQFLIFFPFVRVKVVGKENLPKKGRAIIAANHQNFFDGILSVYALGPFKKVSFLIAKRSVKSHFYQVLAKLIGSVVIGDEAEDYQRALKKLTRTLSHGGWVGIFPEGDVSSRKIPRKFKGGVAKLSIDSQTKVIPIYLTDTYNLRKFQYLLKRPLVIIKIGKPVELYNFSSKFGNNLDEMAGFLREKVIELADMKLTEGKLDKNVIDLGSVEKNIPALDSVSIS